MTIQIGGFRNGCLPPDQRAALLSSLASDRDPYSNTGSDSQLGTAELTAHVDYLALLWTAPDTLDFESLILETFGERLCWDLGYPKRVGILWDIWVSSVRGLSLGVQRGDRQNRYRCTIPGSLCTSVDPSSLWWFCRRMDAMGATCSRFDIAIDDYSKRLSITDCLRSLLDCQYHGFNRWRLIHGSGRSGDTGTTLYLGSRTSERMIRIYDKFLESSGAVDSVRFETEFKGELANSVFLWYVGNSGIYDRTLDLAGTATAGIGFVDRTDKNLQRCALQPFWRLFLERLGERVRPTVRRTEVTIERKLEWVRRSVSKTLAVLGDALGANRIDELIFELKIDAKKRYTSHDEYVIQQYKESKTRTESWFQRINQLYYKDENSLITIHENSIQLINEFSLITITERSCIVIKELLSILINKTISNLVRLHPLLA
jgi:phage replication initiation protein